MSLVLDSSATLAWIYPDESSAAVARVFALVAAEGAWVPSLWRLEVANALQAGVRRGRIDITFRDATLQDLGRLDIRVDSETGRQAWGATRYLSDRFGLTLYDAAYLELANRRQLRLATLDAKLRAASSALGLAFPEA